MTIPIPPYNPGWHLRAKVEWILESAYARVYNATIGPVSAALRAGVDNLLHQIEHKASSYARPYIDQMLASPTLPPQMRELLTRARDPQDQIEIAAVLTVVAGLLVAILQGGLAPFGRLVGFAVERIAHSGRPDPATLVELLRRGRITEQDFDNYMADLGFTEEMRTDLADVIRPRLGISELLTILNRDPVELTGVENELLAQGYTPHDKDSLLALRHQIPGPGDLVRFALREAWDDAVAARWGYDADFSALFGEWMTRQGFSADWAQKYWRAHWELPSLGAGYEMFHRGIITADELAELMKLLDIPTGWRGKLTQMSYNIPTRVDVRRMYEMGVVNREQVKRVYLDLGYDEVWAERLTAWTEVEYQPEDRERTRSDILDGYKRGLLGESEARALLADLGYSAEAISFYIAREQAKAWDALEKERLKLIERQFKRAIITENQAREQMASLGLQAAQIEYNVALWRTAVAENVKRPSVGRLEDFYLDAIITTDQMVDEMHGSGYATKYVTWYMQALDQEAAEKAAAELERARKEEERVRKAREKTDYEQAAATLDVAIAQQNHIIASARQALNEQLTTDQLDSIRLGIEQIDQEIAALRAEIARQRDLEGQARDELRGFITDADRERLESITEDAEIEIASLAEEQAEIAVEIRRLQEEKLITPEIDRLQEIAEEIAAHQTQIAMLRQAVAAQRSIQEQARADLRARIPDETRQRLERQQTAARAGVRSTNVEIADLRTAQEGLRLALAESITADTRQDLEEQITAARTEIARLRVEKAQLRLD